MQRGRGASRRNRISRLNRTCSDQEPSPPDKAYPCSSLRLFHGEEWAAMENLGSLTSVRLNADDGGPNASKSGIRKRQEQMLMAGGCQCY